jgi:tRNA(Ile)-lysidine synthase
MSTSVLPVKGDLRVDPLVRRLGRRMRQEGWLPPDTGALVTVSGGGDSTALLLILHALAEEFAWRLEAVHVNHGVRGDAADRAARQIEALAAFLGIPFASAGVKIAGRPNEEKLRAARFEALRRVAQEKSITNVALGHTQDDLAETVLHRATRGSGLTGIAAMRPVTTREGLTLIRPLLHESRAALRQFLRDHQVAWDEDETNDSPDATRNRIRHVVRPLLAREVNPKSDEALARLARHAADDDAQLEADVDAAAADAKLDLERDEALPLAWLRGLGPSLERRALRRWLMAMAECPLPPPSRHIAEITQRLRADPPPPRWTTFGAVTLEIEENTLRAWLPPRVIVKRWPQVDSPTPPLSIGGPLDLGRGWSIHCARVSGDEARATLKRGVGKWTAFLDCAATEGSIAARPRAKGDRFHPLGMAQEKDLRRFMRDEHIPRCVRARLPLIVDAHRILWIVGSRVAEPVKVTDETLEALRLEVRPPKP